MHARFYAPNLVDGCAAVELPREEAEHLSRVLRLRPGAEVRLFDGRGREYHGRVERIDRSGVLVAVGPAVAGSADVEARTFLVLAQALLKADAMDQVVRDAVMLGASRIVPLDTDRCEMPGRRVTATGRLARWQRIAVASAKQCGRSVVPDVSTPRPLDECLREFEGIARYLLAEPGLAAPAPGLAARPIGEPPASALLLVGPEGGWTPAEAARAIAAGCQPITLGRRTLRADAAALVGLTALQCSWGDFASVPPPAPDPDTR